MATISLENLSKVYPDGTRAVSSLDLAIDDGEFMVFVGPSGCGKTTALRMVAGLEEITEGTVRIGDRVVNSLPPKQRDVAMVFQNYALYPHMSAFDNMAFGLKMRRIARQERRRRVSGAAQALALETVLKKKPRTLSGGQRQRVAMGRAIVREPQAFLMDEPLSNLDAKLRVEMRAEIARIQRDLAATTIYVTHDQVEAMTLGDRVAVMRDGVLQQVGAPNDLYARPANLFVAEFIGSPAMNLVGADVARENGVVTVTFGKAPAARGPGPSSRRTTAARTDPSGVRPEVLEDAASPAGDGRHDRGGRRHPRGPRLGGARPFRRRRPPSAARTCRRRSARTRVAATSGRTPGKGSLFTARVARESRAREGEPIELAVDDARLHFFEIETGERDLGPARTLPNEKNALAATFDSPPP
jgi:multiple sugar transport system ATP-binding protein